MIQIRRWLGNLGQFASVGLATLFAVPQGRGYFAILRLYAPTEPAMNRSWKPGDIEKVN